MSGRGKTALSIVAIVLGWLLLPMLLFACTGPTVQPAPEEFEEPASTLQDAVEQLPSEPPGEATALPEAERPGEAVAAGAESLALEDPVGALSLIRMVASPDPMAEGLQQFPENSGIWIAFYALGKSADETDEYVLRVVDESGATVTEVPLYGPQNRLPDGSQSAVGAGGIVVHATVPVFNEDEPAPAGEFRSVLLLNGAAEADLAWSVAP